MVLAYDMITVIPPDDEFDEDEIMEENEDDIDVVCESSEDEDDLSDADVDSVTELMSAGIFGHHGCVAHTMQLVINTAIKSDEESLEFLKYVQSLMVFIKRSTLWTTELRKHTKLDMGQPARTRWNGFLDMLQRFDEVEIIVPIKVAKIFTQWCFTFSEYFF